MPRSRSPRGEKSRDSVALRYLAAMRLKKQVMSTEELQLPTTLQLLHTIRTTRHQKLLIRWLLVITFRKLVKSSLTYYRELTLTHDWYSDTWG